MGLVGANELNGTKAILASKELQWPSGDHEITM
jgi:hypothetical protein